jgi:AraC-like DNA-binding protein
MALSISDIFFIIVIFQLLFISLFLFTHPKGKRISHWILGSFFLSISLNLLDSFLVLRGSYRGHPAWAGWGICFPVLYGPLLYLYTQSILLRNFLLKGTRWLHFLPFALLFSGFETRYLSLDSRTQEDMLDQIVQRHVPSAFYWSSALIYLQFFLYVGLSLRLIAAYRNKVNDAYSDGIRSNITWLSSTILFFTVCMLLAALNGFIRLTAFSKYYYFFLNFIILAIFIFINRVLLKALRKPEIFSIMEMDTHMLGPGQPKYSGSVISETERNQILNALRIHMETKKPYLESELSLEQLAGQLSLRPKLLSQLINESLHQNFFDFVNRYRIEEAKRLLTNPEDKKITVLEVLYEVGFNSKSSFNTLFKKHTGLTPTEFRKRQDSQA